MRERRSSSFYWLATLFGLFVLFLYGPMITILILSFQGPDGGLTFPMNGVSLHWFAKVWEGLGVVDIWAAFRRSLRLGVVVMVLTVVLSLLAGFAYRKQVARSSQAMGDLNTLPLELEGLTTTVTNPQIYALGTVTTGVSFFVIFSALGLIRTLHGRSIT
jgi:ABC-type spermidine/putrescine transport system permease subunit II